MTQAGPKSLSSSRLGRFPASVQPYVELSRLHYFMGPNLLFWPCAWGLTLAAVQVKMPLLSLLSYTFICYLTSGLLLHSIGATWNDICDRDLDRLVARTKNRPLASGRVSVTQALLFLFPQVLLMLLLLCALNPSARNLGIFGLFFWVSLYPFMKRITHWPQAWLSIACSWSVFVVHASVTGFAWGNTSVGLFIGCFCWCMHYDTIYGMMDRQDDKRVGIYSTALLFGEYARPVLALFAAGFVFALSIVGRILNAQQEFYYLSIVPCAFHLAWQLFKVDFTDEKSCLSMFQSNATQLGYVVYLGFIVIYYNASN
ncbi:hypothetical protein AMATHDRAFT_147891 [Amanita thiersii Skay4041]|uniref:4-hydroxybenzoate polyprenyltransferase, mitochondrial n=1 Tax=Amanita thiersii Skay4041 TaxID=703135 RepID=A0A2A9NNR9_9AGAR|nr:hypothetical protein AMATHDRAFT_147891 [Amanita thiersii Skay4041]